MVLYCYSYILIEQLQQKENCQGSVELIPVNESLLQMLIVMIEFLNLLASHYVYDTFIQRLCRYLVFISFPCRNQHIKQTEKSSQLQPNHFLHSLSTRIHTESIIPEVKQHIADISLLYRRINMSTLDSNSLPSDQQTSLLISYKEGVDWAKLHESGFPIVMHGRHNLPQL